MDYAFAMNELLKGVDQRSAQVNFARSHKHSQMMAEKLDGNPLKSRDYRQISVNHTVKYHWRQAALCFMQVSNITECSRETRLCLTVRGAVWCV